VELKTIAKERRANGDQMQKHKKAIANAIATASKQGTTNIDAVGTARLSDDVSGVSDEIHEKMEAKRRSTFKAANGDVIEEMMNKRISKLEGTMNRILELVERRNKGTKHNGDGANGQDDLLNI
jgi:hypothetical protein